MRWLMHHMAAGRCMDADTGGGGGAPPADPPGGTPGGDDNGGGGSGRDPEDTTALKTALERERAARKELKAQLGEYKARMTELEGASGTLDELKAKLTETNSKLGQYELKERKREALSAAVEKAASDGVKVDQAKALRFIERASGDDAEAIAAEALELFGSKAEEEKKPSGPSRVIAGQPEHERKAAATNLNASQLTELYRTNPEAYEAVVRERRAGNKYLAARGRG